MSKYEFGFINIFQILATKYCRSNLLLEIRPHKPGGKIRKQIFREPKLSMMIISARVLVGGSTISLLSKRAWATNLVDQC